MKYIACCDGDGDNDVSVNNQFWTPAIHLSNPYVKLTSLFHIIGLVALSRYVLLMF